MASEAGRVIINILCARPERSARKPVSDRHSAFCCSSFTGPVSDRFASANSITDELNRSAPSRPHASFNRLEPLLLRPTADVGRPCRRFCSQSESERRTLRQERDAER